MSKWVSQFPMVGQRNLKFHLNWFRRFSWLLIQKYVTKEYFVYIVFYLGVNFIERGSPKNVYVSFKTI